MIGLLFAAATASAPPALDLPPVLVRGRDVSSAGALGAKLPATPATPSAVLPAPSEPRASRERIGAATTRVGPPEATPSAYPMRPAYTELRAGVGGFSRWDLGVYDGRQLDLVPGLDLTAVTRLDAPAGVGPSGLAWSRLSASEAVSFGPPGWGELAYDRAGQDTPGGSALQQAFSLSGAWQLDPVTLRAAGVLGGAWAPGTTAFGERDLDAEGTWTPPSPVDHDLRITASAGQQVLSGATDVPDAHGFVGAQDTWHLAPGWDATLGLGAGVLKGETLLDPEVSVAYRPGPDLALGAGLRAESRYPGFADLYLSRQRVVGNPALLPERRDWLADGRAAVRLAPDWTVAGSGQVGFVRRPLVWRLADAGQGLWQPANAGPDAQADLGFDLEVQHPWTDAIAQSLRLAAGSLQPLGEAHQQIGTRLDASLFDGLVALGASTELESRQLSGFALAGAPAAVAAGQGWQWLADLDVGYRLTAGLEAYLALDAVPVLAPVQPAPGYYAPATLTVVGLRWRP